MTSALQGISDQLEYQTRITTVQPRSLELIGRKLNITNIIQVTMAYDPDNTGQVLLVVMTPTKTHHLSVNGLKSFLTRDAAIPIWYDENVYSESDPCISTRGWEAVGDNIRVLDR